MGRFIARINNYYVEYGDWMWDYVKDRQDKEYYMTYNINATLENLDKKEKIDIEIPLIELVNIKKYRSKYGIDWVDDKSLHKWLFNHIKSKNEKVEGYPILRTARFDSFNEPKVENYYLQTDIGDDDIVIKSIKKAIEIKNYGDFMWLSDRLFYLEY